MEEQKSIRDYIIANQIIFDDVDFTDDDNIFQLGLVNSLFAMKLLNFVEQNFNIKVEDDEIEISNFNSVTNILNLVNKKRQNNGSN